MAKKGRIPGKYTNNERRSRNDRFQEGHKTKNIKTPGFEERYSKEERIAYKKSNPEKMRINKFISNSGVCSRREADTLISKGEIKVNGKVVTELGMTVTTNDTIEYQGKKLIPEKKVYMLLNKPKDTVTTSKDPEGRKTVIEIVRNACPERIYPVGRLDRNTTGVLLLTNDGDLSKKLTHPSFEAKKIYHVFLDKPLEPEDLESIKKGVELEDGLIKPDAVNYVDNDPMQAGIEIHSGKNRIVRRIFEHFDYRVEKLDRVFFAGLTKKNLPRGKWRFLSEKEVRFLKSELSGK